VIYGTTASFPGQFRRFEMTGTKGTVVQVEDSFGVWQFSDDTEEDRRIRERFGQITSEGAVSDPAALPYENHTRNFRAFLNALDEGRRFEIDGAEARKAVALILAVYEAAGQPSAHR
jgi:predicted dehydrogenase